MTSVSHFDDANALREILDAKERLGEKFPRIGILIVSYNAGRRLPETISRIPDALLPAIEEIFVFDDFSSDDTYERGLELLAMKKWGQKLRLHRNPRNYGYGGNQKIGFAHAISKKLDYVILLHGDGQYAPECLPRLIRPAVLENRPVVFGSRMFDRRSALRGGMPLYKWLGNIALTAFENAVLGMRLTDFHSGYRLYSTSVLKHIPFTSNTDDFHFDTQVIIQCRALGIEANEVPIPAYYGEEISQGNGLRYAANVCLSVLEYRCHQLHLVRRPRYQVDKSIAYRLKRSPYSSHGQILSMVHEGAAVFDVGCGQGLLAEQLMARGAQVVGADVLSPDLVSNAVTEYHRLNLEADRPYPTRDFDCIILADVVEHIRRPDLLMQHLARFLKPDGKLILSTGNIAIWFYRLSLLVGRFNYGPRGILDETHVHLYTQSTISHLVQASGFRVLSIKYTGLPFELVMESTGQSRIVKGIDSLYFILVRLWPTLFAYQFVIEAEIRALDTAAGEGRLSLSSGEREAA